MPEENENKQSAPSFKVGGLVELKQNIQSIDIDYNFIQAGTRGVVKMVSGDLIYILFTFDGVEYVKMAHSSVLRNLSKTC